MINMIFTEGCQHSCRVMSDIQVHFLQTAEQEKKILCINVKDLGITSFERSAPTLPYYSEPNRANLTKVKTNFYFACQ